MNEDEKHAPSGSFGSDFLTVTHSRSNQLKSRAFPLRAPATPWIRLCVSSSALTLTVDGGQPLTPLLQVDTQRLRVAALQQRLQLELLSLSLHGTTVRKQTCVFFKHLIGQFRTRRWCWS